MTATDPQPEHPTAHQRRGSRGHPWPPPTGEPFIPLAPPAPGSAAPYMPLSRPHHHVPAMTPATSPRPLPNESTNPLPAVGPLTPPASYNPPPATAPGRQPYPSWVTGADDTCPIPLTQPPATPATPPANKPRRNWPWVIGGILLLPYLIGIIAITGIVSGGDKSSTSTVTTAQPPAPTASPAAPAPLVDLATTFGDGTYIVGTEIRPGTYETTGPAAGEVGMCFWSRLKDTSGNFDSVIASETPQGPTTVTISQTDGAFTTAGCNRWQEVGSLDPRPATG